MTGNGCLIIGIAHLLGVLLVLGVFALTAGHFLVAVDTFSQADAIHRPPIGSSRGRDTVKAAEHFLTDYGDEATYTLPWDLFTHESAEEALMAAR